MPERNRRRATGIDPPKNIFRLLVVSGGGRRAFRNWRENWRAHASSAVRAADLAGHRSVAAHRNALGSQAMYFSAKVVRITRFAAVVVEAGGPLLRRRSRRQGSWVSRQLANGIVVFEARHAPDGAEPGRAGPCTGKAGGRSASLVPAVWATATATATGAVPVPVPLSGPKQPGRVPRLGPGQVRSRSGSRARSRAPVLRNVTVCPTQLTAAKQKNTEIRSYFLDAVTT